MRTLILDPARPYNRLHFIGIGGVSMNALALILHADGYTVSGSDNSASAITDHLTQAGIHVVIGHKPDTITDDISLVVYTAAVRQDNVELCAAQAKGIPVIDRAALLGMVMRNYTYPVCVAGTHGKTTATSMAAEVFFAADKDPTVLVGGVLNTIGGTLRVGGLSYMLAEACEYYDSFLRFCPFVGIILNLEADHLDYFKTLQVVRASFKRFAGLIPQEGTLVINSAIEDVGAITGGLACGVATFGLSRADWTPARVRYDENGCPSFDVCYQGAVKGHVTLRVPGEHNILNSLAVIAAAAALELPMDAICLGLNRFTGVNRRFQLKGQTNGVTVYDDYAHHPTEIKATIAAAKNMAHNRLWVVFQPHTRARTKSLLDDFSRCFDGADGIVILDIYAPAGREEKETDIHAADLVALIQQRGKDARYIGSFAAAQAFLAAACLPGDLVITMGAGDVYQFSERLVADTPATE